MKDLSFIQNFERYRSKAVEIDNFDTPGYSEGGDAGAAVIIDVASDTVGSTKSKVTQFPITYSTGSADWERDITVPKDFSQYTGVTSGAAISGTLQIYIRRDSEVTGIQIKIGSSSSDYVLWVPSIPATTGHFGLKVELSSLTPVGTIDWTQIQYLQVLAICTSGTPVFELAGLHLLQDEGLTNGDIEEEDQEVVYGDTLYAIDKKYSKAGLLYHGSDADDNSNIFTGAEIGDGIITQEFTVGYDTDYEAGFLFRMTQAANGYMAVVQDTGSPSIILVKFNSGTPTIIESHSITALTPGLPFYLRVDAVGDVIKVLYSLDGENFTKVIEAIDTISNYGYLFLHAKDVGEVTFQKIQIANHTSVFFDDWGFADLGIISITKVQERHGPETSLVTEEIAASNRVIHQRMNFRSKDIGVSGVIRANSRKQLSESIQLMKEYISREAKTLKIVKQSCDGLFEEHIYDNVTATNLQDAFEEEPQQTYHATFDVIFRAPEGISHGGKTERDAFVFEDAETVYTHVFVGSFAPRPNIEITMSDVESGSGDINSVDITNVTTGKVISVLSGGAMSDGDVVNVDFENVEVTINGLQVAYTGLASDSFFTSGINKLQYAFRATSTLAINSDFGTSNSAAEFVGEEAAIPSGTSTRMVAQSFEVPVADDYSRFEFQIRIPSGDTPATPKLEIQSDSSGDPSGSLVNAGAEVVGAETAIPVQNTVPGYTGFVLGTPATLSTSTLYWAVFSAEGSGIRTAGKIHRNASEGIPTGTIKYSNNGGSTWNDAFTPTDYYDLNMKVYGSKITGISGTINVTYKPRYV